MTSTLIQMSVLILCGVIWRIVQPAGLSAENTRFVLTSSVFYMFLPALVLLVLLQTDIGYQSLQYTLLGVICIVFALLVIWLIGRLFRFQAKRLGAILLAGAFPNVTYLGLPVLEQTFGQWARSVAIQLDLFATAPMVFTFGIMIAAHYGDNNQKHQKPILYYFNVPPFWAAALAIVLKLNRVEVSADIIHILTRLADAVVPLMLVSLGMALNWRVIRLGNLPYMLPVVLVKLGLMPLLAFGLISLLDFSGAYRTAVLLEMAMPSMVIGLVFCDHYGLDTALYAMAVTVTTLLSLFSLPFWYQVTF